MKNRYGCSAIEASLPRGDRDEQFNRIRRSFSYRLVFTSSERKARTAKTICATWSKIFEITLDPALVRQNLRALAKWRRSPRNR